MFFLNRVCPYATAVIAAAFLLLAANSCTAPASPPVAIRIRWAHDPESLDPLELPNPQAVEGVNLLHGTLLQLDYERRTFEPALAVSLPLEQRVGDSLTLFAFQLRPQVSWDDGQPVTSRDVEFTLKLLACPTLPYEAARSRYGFIQAVQLDPTDSRRFTLICTGHAPTYRQAAGTLPILPEARLDPQGRLRRFSLAQLYRGQTDTALTAFAQAYQTAKGSGPGGTIPGCGPYELMSWQKDARLVFRRKANWWADQVKQPGAAVLQARPSVLEFRILPDDASAALALERGEVEVYPQMPARLFARLRQSPAASRRLAFHTASSFDIVTAIFNTQRPMLADALTRQALSQLFDASQLQKATQLDEGQRTVGLICPADRTNYNDSLPLVAFDPAGAGAMLRRAGWRHSPAGWIRAAPAGISRARQALRLALRYRAGDAMYETIALQFAAAARQLGIPIELLPTEPTNFSELIKQGSFDVCIRSIKGNPFSYNFTPLLHSRAIGESNLSRFSSPACDRLVEAIAEADASPRRARLLRQFQGLFQEQAPLVPLFLVPTRLAASKQLAGVRACDLKPGYVVTALYRVDTKAATDKP